MQEAFDGLFTKTLAQFNQMTDLSTAESLCLKLRETLAKDRLSHERIACVKFSAKDCYEQL